jgi:hypothetical protein
MTLTLAERMAARSGITVEQLQQGALVSETSGRSRFSEVQPSAELSRILALPVRRLGDGEALAALMTEALRTPNGEQRLRPIQALALAEIAETRGGFFPIVAGAGKTVISALVATLLGSRRPMLVVPAGLLKETRDKFRELSKHWIMPHPDAVKLVSYEWLSVAKQGVILAEDGTVSQEGFLERYAPDCVILDECQRTKDPKAVATKRLGRYKKSSGVPFIAMSGTVTKSSIRNYAHTIQWCLAQAPVPSRWTDLEQWAGALDDKVLERIRPGALLSLCSEEERVIASRGPEEELETVRDAYRRRLVSTPGVVATADGKLDVPLRFTVLDPGLGCPKVEQCFAGLRTKGELPNGDVCPDGISEWRHARELSLGMHYQWLTPAPEPWLEARKAWGTWCRLVLKHNRSGLDSEKQVKDAVDVGKLNDGGLLASWREVSGTFSPEPEPVWHSEEALGLAAEFLSRGQGHIVWTEHTFFGERLAALTRLPYYGRKGLSASGEFILERKGKPCIASVASNGTGRNLQAWTEALAMTFPQSALTSEQLTARHHRPGVLSPVTWHLYLGSAEASIGWALAVQGAKYQQASLGSSQRLLYGDSSTVPTPEEIARRPGFRWRK